MSTPLGRTAGNAIEVAESVEVLAGGGPADVVELTLELARDMLAGAGRDDVDPADKLADGSAMDAWKAMIRAQDGDPDAELPTAKESHVVTAPSSGVLTRLDAMAVGLAAWRLGAGRARKEDPVQAGAGVVWHARPGDEVTAGSPLFTLLTDEPARFERALASLEGGYDIAPAGTALRPDPLVIDRVSVSSSTTCAATHAGLSTPSISTVCWMISCLPARQVGDRRRSGRASAAGCRRAPGAGSGPSPDRS